MLQLSDLLKFQTALIMHRVSGTVTEFVAHGAQAIAPTGNRPQQASGPKVIAPTCSTLCIDLMSTRLRFKTGCSLDTILHQFIATK